jgi:hypothetical protein
MKKKNCLIWKKILPIQRRITGRTNTGPESQDTLIVFILATSGTSTIKPITSMSCHPCLANSLSYILLARTILPRKLYKGTRFVSAYLMKAMRLPFGLAV